MFNLFRKKPQPVPQLPKNYVSEAMRPTVWGDMPIENWPPPNSPDLDTQEPWKRFVQARNLIQQGKPNEAIPVLLAITKLPDLETRHYMQAWYFLRTLGYAIPEDKQLEVLAVVVEASMPTGLDLMVVYRDYHARFYSHAGGGTIWEHPDNRLDKAIKDLLHIGEAVAKIIMPAEQTIPAIPPKGEMRFTMITPNGFGYGQGTQSSLMQDQRGKALMLASVNLLNEITKISAR